MQRLFAISIVLFGILGISAAASAPAPDFAGSKDHPVLTRYPGSVIRWYDVQKFMPYKIATGPVTGYRAIGNWLDTQGQVTRIYYDLIGTRTHADVYANYKKALADANFQIVADGHFTQMKFRPTPSAAANGCRSSMTPTSCRRRPG